jgi:hypothetical protein
LKSLLTIYTLLFRKRPAEEPEEGPNKKSKKPKKKFTPDEKKVNKAFHALQYSKYHDDEDDDDDDEFVFDPETGFWHEGEGKGGKGGEGGGAAALA